MIPVKKSGVKIIPSVLAKNKKDFFKEWDKIAPLFSYVQVDIMDGKFVRNKSNIKPSDIKKITHKHGLEVHLMVKDVAKYIHLWEKLNNVKKIIWHYEAEPKLDFILCLNNYLKKKKIKTGICLNPETPINKIAPLAKYFDTIQVMGIKPGAQGRSFHPNVLNKIRKIRKKYRQINISVDGGVNDKNYQKIKTAGANLLILGSYLQKAPDVKKALAKIKTPV